jgi:hypothetical protein
VQADVRTAFLRHVGLQERLVRIQLNRQQVGNIEDARLLAEILADALLFGDGVGLGD